MSLVARWKHAQRRVSEDEAIGTPTQPFTRDALEALLFFLPMLRPHWVRILLLCLIDLVQIVVAFGPPLLTQYLIDEGLATRDWQRATMWLGAIVASGLFVQVVVMCRGMLQAVLAARLSFDIRMRTYAQLQRLSIRFAESTPVGLRVFRNRIDADAVATILAGFFPTLTRFVEFGLVLFAVTYLDPVIALIALGFLVPWAAAMVWVTGVFRLWDRRRLMAAELRDSAVLQSVSSFPLLKAYARERTSLRRHGKRSVKTQRLANVNYLIWWVYDMAVLRLIPYARTFTVTFYLYRKVIYGELTLGATVPMLAFVQRMSEPIQRIVEWINELRRAVVPMERLMQTLQVQTAVPVKPNAQHARIAEGRLGFEGISYRHGNGPWVLRGLDLQIAPGQRTALVGPSGAGKSTVAALAVRLYDPVEGTVRIDGLDLRDLNPNSFVQDIAVVTQETFIFAGTLRDNLRYGREDASDADMMAALERVELGAWVAQLPEGLDTDLESGNALSVGQKQRIGIARVLLARPKLWILDEPTSALDTETETAVMDVLWRLSEGATVLLVTHRMNTTLRCDRVAVLSGGIIVEEGPPTELLARGGAFARLHATYYETETP